MIDWVLRQDAFCKACRALLSAGLALQLCLGTPALASSNSSDALGQDLAGKLIADAISASVGHKVDMGGNMDRPAGGLSRSSKRIIGLLGGMSALLLAKLLHPKLAVRDDLSAVAEARSVDGRFAVVSLHSGALGLWDLRKGAEIARLDGPVGGATALAIKSDGRLIAIGGADGAVAIHDLKDSTTIRPAGGVAVSAVALAPDGSQLAVALNDGTMELWDVLQPRLVASAKADGRPLCLDFETGGPLIGLTANANAFAWDTRAASVTRLSQGHLDIAAAQLNVATKTATILRGDQDVSVLDLATGKSRRLFASSETVRTVMPVSTDGVLAIGKLGTLVLLSAQNGGRLAQLVTTARGWAVLDNAGRFDGSTRGLTAISWQQGEQSFDIQQFAAEYFEPAILSKLVIGEAVGSGKLSSPENGMRLPPTLKIIIPPGMPHTGGVPFPVVVVAEDSGGGIQDLRLFHNGKVVDAGSMVQTRDYDDGSRRLRAAVFKVLPKAGLNTFRASAASDDEVLAWSARSGAPFTGREEQGVLHVLAVGINAYSHGAPHLTLAVADANGVVSALAKPSLAFGKTSNVTLLDAKADRAAILHALDDIAAASNPEDTVIVYLAGHGFALNADEWVFGPVGVDMSNPDTLRATGVSAAELQAALVKVNARRIVLAIDACQSATAFGPFLKQRSLYLRLLSDISRSTGIVVYAATKEQEAAQELDELQHGVFTYVLISGLAGQAQNQGADVVTAFGLADYLEDAVPLLVRQKDIEDQDSMTFQLGADFPIH